MSVAALVVALIGFGACLASLIDYLGVDPTFCAESGCATVRASAWAHPLGIPMPLFGLVFYGAMTVLGVVSRPRVRIVLAIGGAAWALGLIALQAFSIGAWCKLCMIADPAAIVLAALVIAGATTVKLTATRALLLAPAVAILPITFAVLGAPTPATNTPRGVPDVIAKAQTPGHVTIVEFVDFECPFCRKLAPKLDAAIDQARQAQVPVRVVRKMVPLDQHKHAKAAALAWCCADAQGRGDAMAQELFAAAPDALTPENCEQLAVKVGCDRDRYRATLADPHLSERIER